MDGLFLLCSWICITAITTLITGQSLLWFAILWCSCFHYKSTERSKMDEIRSSTLTQQKMSTGSFCPVNLAKLKKRVVNGFQHGQSVSVFKKHFLPRSGLSFQENNTSLFNRIRFLGLNCVNHWFQLWCTFPDDGKVKWHLSSGLLIGNKNCNSGLFTHFLYALLFLS